MLVFHHKQKPVDGIHVPYNFEYIDAIERLAAADFVEDDIGKLAIQHDSKTLWILTAIAPVSWIQASISQEDKNKIDSGNNQNAFSSLLVSGTEIVARNPTDVINFVAGDGVIFSTDVTQNQITIESTGGGGSLTTHGATHIGTGTDPIPDASSTASGLMSPADKAKVATIKNLVAGTNIILTPQGDNLVIASSGSGTGTSVHGLLTGLEQDDHLQYLNVQRHNSPSLHTLGQNIPIPNLSELPDTAIFNPSNDQVLTYSNGNWINKYMTSASGDTTLAHAATHLPGHADAIPLAKSSQELGGKTSGLMSGDDKDEIIALSDSFQNHKSSTQDDHLNYIHLSEARTVQARHTFRDGANFQTSTGDNTPINITLDGTSEAVGAIVIHSTNPAERADELVRWGIYAEHASYGAVIAAVPKGISYAGFHARTGVNSNQSANCYLANLDDANSTGSVLWGVSAGTGSMLRLAGTNANAGHAINVAYAGTGSAEYLTQSGTGRGLTSVTDGVSSSHAIVAQVYNTSNTAGNAIYGIQGGLGSGIRIDMQNAASSSHALYANSYASSNSFVGYFKHNNGGSGVYINAVGAQAIQSYGNLNFYQGNLTVHNGNATISGTLTAGVKNFLIDHPIDPENKSLVHSTVEAPEMKNIYDGVVELNEEGIATVELPSYFEALNKDFRYQLTAIDESMPNLCAGRIQNRILTIKGGSPNGVVSWQVVGIRQDKFAQANPMIVERVKAEPGYIHPELYE